MEGRHEGLEPLDRAYDLSSLSGEVEAVGRGDRSMQQCPWRRFEAMLGPGDDPAEGFPAERR